jgi:hypothetical protein
MSNTDILRRSEAELLPPGFLLDHVFNFGIDGYEAVAEVDGFHPVSREAIEICQSQTDGAPKPGQKRKLASDVLKLIFLKDLGLIKRGRVFITSPEMYTWCQQTGSWLSAARKHYHIDVILVQHPSKTIRKQVRNALQKARREKS